MVTSTAAAMSIISASTLYMLPTTRRGAKHKSPDSAKSPDSGEPITVPVPDGTTNPLRYFNYNGTAPVSVGHLLAMGAMRNEKAVVHSEEGEVIDESAALENDTVYFKALLEARRKYRSALQERLGELQRLRAKKSKSFKKRGANICGSTASRQGGSGATWPRAPLGTGCMGVADHAGRADAAVAAWASSQSTSVTSSETTMVCASPVSLDEEIEEGYKHCEAVMCNAKPAIYSA